MKKISETNRLVLREFNPEDAPFIVELLNSPGWLRFIGDRGVRTEEDARKYLQERLMASYASHGFGFWHVSRKTDGLPIGMCGFIQRDFLEAPDIGYALLPDQAALGYAQEMGTACLQLAKNQWGIRRMVAITDFENERSIALLLKLGLRFEKRVAYPGETQKLLLFGTAEPTLAEDETAIAALTRTFFSIFDNRNGQVPALEKIRDLFVPQGMVVKNSGPEAEIYNLEQFLLPRQKLLADGTLTDFWEREIVGRSDIFGNIAQRFCLYKKSGTLNGAAFEAVGMKSIQFLRTSAGWRISALAWDNARE